jgi:hypothetical protein
VHPGAPVGWLRRIGEMLKDVRTWTTLLYLLLMLPVGIIYFTVAVTALSVGLAFAATPLLAVAQRLGLLTQATVLSEDMRISDIALAQHSLLSALLLGVLGALIVTLLMHVARGVARGHARLAKALLVEPGA